MIGSLTARIFAIFWLTLALVLMLVLMLPKLDSRQMTELLDSEQRQGLMIEQHVEAELANDPPTYDASRPERVNQNRARSFSNTDGCQGIFSSAVSSATLFCTKKWINASASAAQKATSQKGSCKLYITSRVQMGGPTVQPMFRKL